MAATVFFKRKPDDMTYEDALDYMFIGFIIGDFPEGRLYWYPGLGIVPINENIAYCIAIWINPHPIPGRGNLRLTNIGFEVDIINGELEDDLKEALKSAEKTGFSVVHIERSWSKEEIENFGELFIPPKCPHAHELVVKVMEKIKIDNEILSHNPLSQAS